MGVINAVCQIFLVLFPRKYNAEIQADRWVTVDSIPAERNNKVNIEIKPVTWIFWLPSAYESYIYIVL